ncbi:MAG: hypothetical protein WAM15_03425, partial [Candidatus Acidiferrales bacterium]
GGGSDDWFPDPELEPPPQPTKPTNNDSSNTDMILMCLWQPFLKDCALSMQLWTSLAALFR